MSNWNAIKEVIVIRLEMPGDIGMLYIELLYREVITIDIDARLIIIESNISNDPGLKSITKYW